MGIVNATPDSFTDGGRWLDPEAAIRHGLILAELGADIVDVGGESTRPGAIPVGATEEISRISPIVEALSSAGVVVSVDTSKPAVASAAIALGAEIVNDVTGLADPELLDVCARSGPGVVLMHMQGDPRSMQIDPQYGDVVTEVADYLKERAGAAMAAGIAPSRIVVDPGIGFGKTFEHNLDLMGGIDRVGGEFPILVGTSRKGFLGTILDRAGLPSGPGDRDTATGATVTLAIAKGASIVRVHDVAGAISVARTTDAIVRFR
jgi:dihydropteroate synthase